MAWNYYLNLEPIAIKAAWDAASHLGNSNELEDLPGFPDTDAFCSNLQFGYTALVMGFSFVESSINTILRHICGCASGSEIMFDNIENKICYLMREHPDDLSRIKGCHCWQCFKKAEKIRNSLIHYKENKIDRLSTIAPLNDWKIGKQIAGDFFTKQSIENCLDGLISLVEEITTSLGLEIAEGMKPIIPDASGAPIDFIYHKKDLPEDWDLLKDQVLSNSRWRLRPMKDK